jgi:hypothetical protein
VCACGTAWLLCAHLTSLTRTHTRTPALSAGAEHGLLGEYHDALSEGGVTAYSMYDAWEDYRCGARPPGSAPCVGVRAVLTRAALRT